MFTTYAIVLAVSMPSFFSSGLVIVVILHQLAPSASYCYKRV
jgi:hypothetical protein